MRDLSVLTATELKVVELLAHGKQYKNVAFELNMSLHTVSTHVRNVYHKLHVTNLVQLALTYHGVDYARKTSDTSATAHSAEVDRAIRAKRYVVGTDCKDFRVRSFDVV